MHDNIRRRPEGALLRTYLAAAGLHPETSAGKPLIGVVSCATQIFSERPDAQSMAAAVMDGVRAAGGIVVRWDTVRTPDLMVWGHAESYSFAWRDQLADLIESWSQQEALDGLVLIGDAPESLAGMAMAAARLNGPAIMVTAGPSRFEYKGKPESRKEAPDPFHRMSEVLFARKREADVSHLEHCVVNRDNHAAHAMDVVLEALGVTLPGMSTIPAQSFRRQELGRQSGQRIMDLVQSSSQFRRFLTANAFANAIRLNAALGGAVDAAIHLMALARESGVDLSWDVFDRIARETPQVCRLGAQGLTMEDVDRAGGVWAVLHALKDSVLPATTVGGRGAAELAKNTAIKDPRVIAASRPFAKRSGVGVLRGNLAPHGALYLLNQVPAGLASHHGVAMVFENEVDAARAVADGKVKKGSVLIVRRQGPKGGPGLRVLRLLPVLMESRGLNKTVPLITDGRLPDAPQGLFISSVSPEAVVPGALAVLKDGDRIEIDLERRALYLRLTEMDLKLRLARWQSPGQSTKAGFLARYSRSVSEAHEGAILK